MYGDPFLDQAPAPSGRLVPTEGTILHTHFTHQHTFLHLQFYI